jgi:hypothetical protein
MNTAVIEAHIARLSDTMHRQLANTRGHCWLLLDPAIRPVGQDSPLGCLLADRTCFTAPSMADIDVTMMPQIIAFDPAKARDHDLVWQSLSEALVELAPDMLAQGVGRRIGGWLESDADGPQLALHIASQMIQRNAQGRRRLLRWADPAVLWALWPILNGQQQSALLGPIKAYRLLDPAGHWHCLRAPHDAKGEALGLDSRQWQRIEAIAALNGVLREQSLSAHSPQSLCQLRDTLMAALEEARHFGFADSRDQTAYARRALAIHPAFARHPLVAERLAKRKPDDYFSALIDDLSAGQWAGIQRDCSKSAS